MSHMWLLLFGWVIHLLQQVVGQDKGDKFRMIQAGTTFQLVLGNMGQTGPTPNNMLVGGWFKWNRCRYASVKGSQTLGGTVEPNSGSSWIQFHYHNHDLTQRRVFSCSSWQHVAIVFTINPADGQMTPAYVLHKPMLRVPLNFDEVNTLTDPSTHLEILQSGGTGRFVTEADLVQHRLFWYLDYTGSLASVPFSGVASAYGEILAGLASPLSFNIMTERYFNRAPAIRINGTSASGSILTSFINDYDPTSRPGFSLRWNTTYEFPDLIQLPEVDGEYAIEPCITLILSFRVETSFNERNHKISTSINIQKGTFSLLRNFKLEQNFWSKGGKQNGTAFNLNPQNGRYQNLTSVISICYFPDFWSMRHELFRDGTRVVNLKGTHFRKDYFSHEAGLLNLRLSTTSNSARGNLMFLKSVRVLRGAANPRDIVLTKTALPSGCLVYRLIPARFNEEVLPHCYACDENHFLHQGACLPQVSGNPGQNSTCSFWEGLNYCAACISSHRADLHRYECTPSNFVCQAPQFTLDSVNQVCSNRDFNSACSIFQFRNSSTNLCQCQVDHCGTCSFSQCEACNPGYSLVVDGKDVRCEASPLVGKGPAPKLGLLSTTIVHQVCSIKDCLACSRHSNICDTCQATSNCFVNQICDASCYKCTGGATTECTSCEAPLLFDNPTSRCISLLDCQTDGTRYVSLSGRKCKQCHVSCQTCSGGGTKDCLTCASPSLLSFTGECVTCPTEGYYPTVDSCLLCHPNCKTCSGPDPDDCLTCQDGFYYVSGECVGYCDGEVGKKLNDKVSSGCNGQFPVALPYIITGCSVTTDCSIQYTKITNIKYSFQVGMTCTPVPVAGPCQFTISGISMGTPNVTFEDCDGVTPKTITCTSFIAVSPLNPPYTVATSGALVTCFDSTGDCTGPIITSVTDDRDVTAICTGFRCSVPCPANCDRCAQLYGPCMLCKVGYYLIPSTGLCDPCDTTTGLIPIGTYCYNCHSSCAQCTGTSINDCSDCQPGNYFMTDPAGKTFCVPCIKTGQFVEDSTLICKTCQPICMECQGQDNHCTKCHPGTYLQGTTCVSSCAPADKTIPLDGVCRPCDPNCETCGPLSTSQCLSCTSGNLLYPALEKCIPAAQAVHVFSNPISSVVIEDCSPSCQTCSATQETCLSCSNVDSLFMHLGSVCDYCPTNGYFLVGTECRVCDSSCLDCSSTPSTCTACVKGLYLFQPNSTCITCDFLGVYRNSSTQPAKCLFCNSNCSSCSTGDTCDTCIPGLFLYPNKTCGECQEKNRAKVGSNCVQCNENCVTCRDGTDKGCLSCTPQRYLNEEGACAFKALIGLPDGSWSADLKEVTFLFSDSVVPFSGSLSDSVEIGLFDDSLSVVRGVLDRADGSDSLDRIATRLTRSAGWRMTSLSIADRRLKIASSFSNTVSGATMVVRSKNLPFLRAANEQNKIFDDRFLVQGGVNLVLTNLDASIGSASSTVSGSVTVLTSLLFLVSIPQAFILMKVFQTIDFYIYINCEYPSNFSSMLEIFSQSLIDFVPNLLEPLADEEGVPVYPRFEKFGLSIHVFKNLGRHFTFFSAVGLFKLLVMGLHKLLPKVKLFAKLDESFDKEMALTMVEGFHLDMVLGIMIHIENRNNVDNTGINFKYLAIVFISVLSLALLGVYIYMAYTVSRITKAYYQYGLLKVEDMADESLKGLLQDKQMGNIFQRHFNLLLMMKDLFVCSLLLAVYKQTMVLLTLLTIYQFVFFVLTLGFPPYLKSSSNWLLWITQGMYLLLDAAFLINVGLSITEEVRYFYVGISMISIVAVIILANSGMSTFQNLKTLFLRCRAKCAKPQQNSQVQPESKLQTSMVEGKLNNSQSSPVNKRMLLSPSLSKLMNQGNESFKASHGTHLEIQTINLGKVQEIQPLSLGAEENSLDLSKNPFVVVDESNKLPPIKPSKNKVMLKPSKQSSQYNIRSRGMLAKNQVSTRQLAKPLKKEEDNLQRDSPEAVAQIHNANGESPPLFEFGSSKPPVRLYNEPESPKGSVRVRDPQDIGSYFAGLKPHHRITTSSRAETLTVNSLNNSMTMDAGRSSILNTSKLSKPVISVGVISQSQVQKSAKPKRRLLSTQTSARVIKIESKIGQTSEAVESQGDQQDKPNSEHREQEEQPQEEQATVRVD